MKKFSNNNFFCGYFSSLVAHNDVVIAISVVLFSVFVGVTFGLVGKFPFLVENGEFSQKTRGSSL
ncbi:MAG: hypothetical protein Q4D14_05945 [Bacteroidales bacterium]|nr:hypothetical protein [Bacteroidales bacterium]